MRVMLPDGSFKEFETEVNGLEVAKTISTSLSKAAVAVRVNGELRDLSDPVPDNAEVAILTSNDDDGLDIMRHTIAAQVLARAIKNLYPSARLAIGPTIKDGFYYDIAFEENISLDDLEKIEKEMHRIIKEGHKIEKKVYNRADAISLFKDRGEDYKVKIIEDTPNSDAFQIYHQGETSFIDLCRGPHLPSLGKIGAFKLTKVAGAYWRGNSQNEMLTRIYGTAWRTQEDLDKYLHQIEEAEKRDHRKIGKEMDLFHLQEEAQGSVFWHPHGFTIYRELESYIREKIYADGYVEVKTPQLMHSKFWEASGHWDKYRENMFVVPDVVPNIELNGPVFKEEPKEFMALKPMNCPAHVQIFKHGIKSYRDLPIRMAEMGCCHRNEAHGALHGLMRVRQMTQDDAHIFCREDQIGEEVKRFVALFKDVYNDFGFTNIKLLLATRPDKRAGTDETWDKAEKAMADALNDLGMDFEYAPGEGAFYGPKYEFHLVDSIGRTWQCGTCQLDFVLPERLDASYMGADGGRYRPVMIHRAVFGSFERFIGLLIESTAGIFPFWLSPTQLVISGVTEANNPTAEALVKKFKAEGIRVEFDGRNEKISYKVREHMNAKVTYVGIIGNKEQENGTITVRRLGVNEQETYTVDEFLTKMKEEIKTRALPPTPKDSE
ncbi:MAG: threonine--tRNA ligase [Alphaproteobacteria bacterium CG1_02_46_17]|nr:MAG: threonine--tRNA ligase [Alphaproteobacteria bacterium CG1_02_46_17]